MAIFGIYVRFLGWVTNQSLVCSPRKSNGPPFEKKRLIHHPKGGWWPETLFLLATKVLMLEQSRLPCICFLIEGIMQKHGTCLMKSSRYENSCGVFFNALEKYEENRWISKPPKLANGRISNSRGLFQLPRKSFVGGVIAFLVMVKLLQPSGEHGPNL